MHWRSLARVETCLLGVYMMMLLLIVVGFLPRLIGSPLLAQSSYNIWFFEGNSYWSNGFSLRKLSTLYYTNIYILKKSNINRQQTSRMICHEIVWCVDEMKKTVKNQKKKKKIKMKLQLFFFLTYVDIFWC